jgi:tRNA pseudouridine55 synthase
MDGILVVAKPAGMTSSQVVALVRRLTATKRVGHGGTLDPFATGVLPIFLGHATRLAEYHLTDLKAYRATICFGARSTTDDLEGELEPVAAPPPSRATVETALASFLGTIRQRPPAFSALKVGGRRAYALARSGESPELAEREVTIERLALVEWDASDPQRPVATVELVCSAGTYVRAFARDLGEAVGNAAYLGALVRTAAGPFRLEDAVSLDAIRQAAADGPEGLRRLLWPPDAGLEHFPRVTLGRADAAAIIQGQFIRPPASPPLRRDPRLRFRLYDPDGRLIAIGVWRGGRLAPDKVLVNPDAGEGIGARGAEAAEHDDHGR